MTVAPRQMFAKDSAHALDGGSLSLTPGKPYTKYVEDIIERLGTESGVRAAVGGDFVATGFVEAELLRSLGLKDGDMVVDVGCGSGRLAYQLRGIPTVRFLGTDVVPQLLEYARTICERPDWEFREARGWTIPAPDESADFVCFFSVFTHLLHEQSFRYLKEAARVLKPGGRVVLSFLEFRLAAHWQVFEDTLQSDEHLNQFIERDAIGTWARRLGVVVESIVDGDKPFIPLSRDVLWPDGSVMSGKGNLGQSVAVLRVPDRASCRPLAAAIREDASPPANLAPAEVVGGPPPISSLSVRGLVGVGDAVLIGGFTIHCRSEVLLVATGQSLLSHHIANVLRTPHLLAYDAAGNVIDETRGWRHLTSSRLQAIEHAFAILGLPQLDPGGDDCALLLELAAGTYSAVVRSGSDRGGIIHLQVLPVPHS